jgi:hypothetical protein
MNGFYSTVRERLGFKDEWTWRLFLVLQLLGFIGLIFLRVNTPDWWQILPYMQFGELKWDLFDSRFWSHPKAYNWLTLLTILGPYLCAIAIDWICDAKKR